MKSCFGCTHRYVCQYRFDTKVGSFPLTDAEDVSDALVVRLAKIAAENCREYRGIDEDGIPGGELSFKVIDRNTGNEVFPLQVLAKAKLGGKGADIISVEFVLTLSGSVRVLASTASGEYRIINTDSLAVIPQLRRRPPQNSEG